MLQLQLEKTLPYPLEDVSHGFEILSQGENESTVITFAASRAQLDTLCAPMREKGRVPGRITLQALRVAASCPDTGTILALWPEQGQTACAIVSDGKLAWAQPIPGLGPDAVLGELPGLLLSAELPGVPADFSEIRISEEAGDLADGLVQQFSELEHQIHLRVAAYFFSSSSSVRGRVICTTTRATTSGSALFIRSRLCSMVNSLTP
jgi:hypothetical protein